eukprot:5138338-Amphidinium_carterae.1
MDEFLRSKKHRLDFQDYTAKKRGENNDSLVQQMCACEKQSNSQELLTEFVRAELFHHKKDSLGHVRGSYILCMPSSSTYRGKTTTIVPITSHFVQ